MTSGKIFASAWSQDRSTAGGTCAAVGSSGLESGESIAPLQEHLAAGPGSASPIAGRAHGVYYSKRVVTYTTHPSVQPQPAGSHDQDRGGCARWQRPDPAG